SVLLTDFVRSVFCSQTLCGIAGYSLGLDSRVERTVAARALLAGIAERGADAVGYAFRSPGSAVTVHKQRSGATALLDRLRVPRAAAWLAENRPDLLLARGMGRPLWLGVGKRELFFASTRLALELVESYGGLKLKKSQLQEGTVIAVENGAIVARDAFTPDL